MHVYVRLSGWGLQVLPEGDFEAAWDEEGRYLDVKLYDRRFARIHVDGSGGYRSQIDSSTTKSLYDVVQIQQGEADPYWRVETSLCRFVWPAGYWIMSRADDPAGIVVDLMGPNGECIFIQNPRKVPPLGEMAGPGQSMLDQDDEARAVLLGYTLDGVEWRQRHKVVTVGTRELIISGQAPAQGFAGVERVMGEIASDIGITPGW